jgi:hypothetical protein
MPFADKTTTLDVIGADIVVEARSEVPETNSVREPPSCGEQQSEDCDLANELQETANRIRRRTGSCLIENGRDLLRARAVLKHGQLRRWVEGECGLTMRLAQLAMRVAEYADASDKGEIISHLPVTVQYLIAAKSVPEAIREQILDRFATGERLKVDDVKRHIQAATRKPSRQPPKRASTAVDPADVQDAAKCNAAPTEASLVAVSEADTVTVASPLDEGCDANSDAKRCQVFPAISQHRLDAATQDPEKQSHIKSIYDILRRLNSIHRVNLVSHLGKRRTMAA